MDKDCIFAKEGIVNTFHQMFPELKESEDERIKEDIIRCLKYSDIKPDRPINPHVRTTMKDALIWLEKQGKPTDINPSEFDLRLNKLLKQFEILPKEELVNCLSFYLNVVQNDRTYKDEEKQGEQKPILDFNADDWYVSKVDGKIYNVKRDNKTSSCVQIKKQVKNLTNKVEPKFKVGDYVKNVNDKREPIYEIVYIDKECYICEYRGKERMGDKAIMHFSFDNPYLRLIQKSADKVEPKFKVKYAGSEYNVLDIKEIAGIMYYGIEDEPNHIDYVLPDNCEIIFDQKTAWSEEDEEIYQSIIDDTVQENQLNNKQTNWLRDIKYRYFPQPKKEWSEDDEKMYRRLYYLIYSAPYCDSRKELSDWFKSLKERYTWKHSDMQIKALNDINTIGDISYIGQVQELINLYKELKKLREE